MPELDTQIRDYVEATSRAITVDELTEQGLAVAASQNGLKRRFSERRPDASGPTLVGQVSTRKGLLIAAAVMVLVLVVMGVTSLVTYDGETPDPVDSVPTTAPAPAPSTAPVDSVSTTSPAPVPSTAPATGTSSTGILHFTAVEWPRGDYLSNGAWFNGSFYAPGASGDLYSTTDGLSWDVETGFDADGDAEPASISVGDDELVVLTSSAHDTIGSIECSQPGDFIEVSLLSSDGSWTSSRIDLPLDRPSTIAGCISFQVGTVAVGAEGIMVAGGVSGELPFEAIIVDVLGEEVLDSMSEVRPEGDTLVVVWRDGAQTDVIDLAELGLADDIAEYAAFARELIGSDEGDNTWFGERPLMWFSSNGEDWSPVQRTGGPMDAHQIETIVSTPGGGFIARSDTGAAFMTVDGTSWEPASLPREDVYLRQGQLVTFGEGGVTPLLNPDHVLIPIPPEVSAGLRLYVGEMGVIGGGDGGFGYDFPISQPFTFSTDGATWETWTPPEFEGLEGWASLIGMGDEFVIFNDWETQRLWVGTLEPQP